jgi:GTP-binding nuclear protein Ran
MESKQTNEFKVVLIGDRGTGKSAFVRRHLTGEFEKEYKPTKDCETFRLNFFTNFGVVVFEVFDTAGGDPEIIEKYLVGAQGACIFFDISVQESYNHVESWFSTLNNISPNIPVVTIGHKVDLKTRIVKPKHITFHRKKKLYHCDVSSKSNFQLERPLLYLARKLAQREDLEFVEVCGLACFNHEPISQAVLDQMAAEIAAAAAIPLPDDCDDL